MIRAGIDVFRAAQASVLSIEAVYRRGSEESPIKAVLGRTAFRVKDAYGTWVRILSQDFIVSVEQLAFEPSKGDVIVFDGGEYEVLAPSDEAVWRWSDPYHTARRIHTKHIGGEE